MTKQFLTVLILNFASFFCFGQGTIQSITSDSIAPIQLIPYNDSCTKHERGQPSLSNFAKLMELHNLAAVKEGLYIRIWFWNDEKKYVVTISDVAGKRECSVIKFNSKVINNKEFIAIYKNWQNIQPRSGWDSFFCGISRYHIQDRQGGTIQKRTKERLTLMSYAQFEVGSPSTYLFYEYLEPSFYRYVDKKSDQIDSFLNFLSHEIKINVYHPERRFFVKPR